MNKRVMRPPRWRAVAEAVLTTLWVGALWTAGFLVAPTMFAVLDDPAQAGRAAGSVFRLVGYLGLACGAALLALDVLRPAGRWRRFVLAGMLMLVALQEFLLHPMLMAASGTPRAGTIHGVASAVFVITSLLGLVLVVGGAWRESDGAGSTA